MKKQTDNVIMFPNKGNHPPVISKEKAAIDVTMVKMNHINDALETIIPMLFNNISIAGFDILPEEEDDDLNIKDNALVVESIRSILCKYYEINHPLQEVAEEFFTHKEDGILTVSKHLDLDLSHYDKE
jgi:hypothetical protein